MKKLLVIILFFGVNLALAQIQKGTIVVGGGLNLNGESGKRTDYDDYDSHSKDNGFGISAGYAKFKNESTAYGLFISYSYMGYNSEYEFEFDSAKYGSRKHMVYAGPTVTKYIPIRDKLFFTVGSGISLGIGQGKDIDSRIDDRKSTIWSAGVSASPGLAFFLNDNFALSASIGSLYYRYSSEKSKEENINGEKPKETYHSYGLSFNVNTFTIGLKYYLRTAKSE
jgi:hypothetical protein